MGPSKSSRNNLTYVPELNHGYDCRTLHAGYRSRPLPNHNKNVESKADYEIMVAE